MNAVFVDVALELSDEALPWHDALIYETYVDSERWHASSHVGELLVVGQSWQGRGRDRIHTVCDSQRSFVNYATEGTHTVEIRAWHPGHTAMLASTTVTIELVCPGDDGADVPDSPDEDEGGQDEGGDDDSGGCATAPSSAPPTTLLVLLALGGVFIRWRRRPAR